MVELIQEAMLREAAVVRIQQQGLEVLPPLEAMMEMRLVPTQVVPVHTAVVAEVEVATMAVVEVLITLQRQVGEAAVLLIQEV